MTETSEILIYCDGACSGNPGPGGWAAIVAIADKDVWELGGRDPATTNNRMELRAAIEALRTIEKIGGPVTVFTDSVYVIKGITEWIFGWRRRGWKSMTGEPVANREHWEELSYFNERRKGADVVQWKFVKGHSGHPGNDRVDEIAVAFSKNDRPRLYRGSFLGYDHSLEAPPDREVVSKKIGKTSTAAFSYLSLVDGVLMTHRTWTECERRVKGKSGAKFKKSKSKADEEEIIKSWGIKAR